MANILALTSNQRRDIISAIHNPRFLVSASLINNMHKYTICDKKGRVIYSIDVYKDDRHVVTYCGNVIADSNTFGNNIVELRYIKYIISVLMERYNREASMDAYVKKR